MTEVKHALVTGATGFIGRSLCERLRNQNIKVTALNRKNSMGPWDKAHLIDFENLDQFYFDPTWFLGVDTVFHLAGVAHAHAPLEKYQNININATKALLTLAIQKGVKQFIYFSSVKASDAKDFYGWSKREAEKLILEMANHSNIKVVIVRPALVYGDGVKGNLASLIRGIKKGWFPPLPEVNNERSMIWLEDLITASMILLQHPNVNGKIYTITDGFPYSTRQIYDGIRKALGKKPIHWSIPDWLLRFLFCKLIKKEDFYYKLMGSAFFNNDEICKDTGWLPTQNFFKSLPSMLKVYNSES